LKSITGSTTEQFPKIGARASRLFFILGIFLLLHALCLGQLDLEERLVPLHLAWMGYVGACIFSALGSRVRALELLAVMILSILLSLLSGQIWILALGWVAFIVWSTSVAFRGGRK